MQDELRNKYKIFFLKKRWLSGILYIFKSPKNTHDNGEDELGTYQFMSAWQYNHTKIGSYLGAYLLDSS